MDNTLIDRIVGVFSRAAMPIVSCALAMAIAFIPGTALAGADEEGDLDAPNAAAGGTSAQSAQEDTAIDDAVNIAADGKSASVEGSPFALEDFSRSQVGSNSDVNGVYAGYRYFVSDESGSLAVVATDELTVVHVPSETAQAVGFDAESSESRGFLKQLLVALDAQNSKGGATLVSYTHLDVYKRQALCGLTFFIAPAMLGVFLSVFILMRGASLIFYGWNAGKAMAA